MYTRTVKCALFSHTRTVYMCTILPYPGVYAQHSQVPGCICPTLSGTRVVYAPSCTRVVYAPPVPGWVSRYCTRVGIPLLYHGGYTASLAWWVYCLPSMVGVPS